MKQGNWWPVAGLVSISLLMGIYAGLSASPVVSTILSAVLGVLAGVSSGLFTKRDPDKNDEPGEKGKGGFSLTPENLTFAGKAAVVFSAANLFGAMIGIEARTGSLSAMCFGAKEQNIVSVANLVRSKKVGPDLYLRLIIIQRAMLDGGVSAAETNSYLNSLVDDQGKTWQISESRLEEIEEFLRSHWNFLSNVRKSSVESSLRKLRDDLTINKVSEEVWKQSLDEAQMSIARQPADYESEQEQAAMAKALHGIRALQAPEIDVVFENLSKLSKNNNEVAKKGDYRPALAN